MSTPTPVSQIVAYDSGAFMGQAGYFNPSTLEPIGQMDALVLIEQEHALGLAVHGIDAQGDVPVIEPQDLPITEEVNARNLKIAAANVIAGSSLEGIPPSEWTTEQRAWYIEWLRTIILNNASHFTPATIAVANGININRDFSQSSAADFGVWVTGGVSSVVDALTPSLPGQAVASVHAAANALVDAVKGISGAVSKGAFLLEWVLPLAAVGVVWYAVKSIGKDPGGQAGKFIGAGTKAVATFV